MSGKKRFLTFAQKYEAAEFLKNNSEAMKTKTPAQVASSIRSTLSMDIAPATVRELAKSAGVELVAGRSVFVTEKK